MDIFLAGNWTSSPNLSAPGHWQHEPLNLIRRTDLEDGVGFLEMKEPSHRTLSG